MKTSFLIIFCFLVISVVRADFDFQSYRSTTFQNIKKQHANDLLAASRKSEYVISAESFKYVMPVSFTKVLRKLSSPNKDVLKAWQKTLRVPDSFINLYRHEFKVEFNGESFWIPVQEDLLLPMNSELHQGDSFELYVVLIGAKDNQLVMLATEFKSGRYPQ